MVYLLFKIIYCMTLCIVERCAVSLRPRTGRPRLCSSTLAHCKSVTRTGKVCINLLLLMFIVRWMYLIGKWLAVYTLIKPIEFLFFFFWHFNTRICRVKAVLSYAVATSHWWSQPHGRLKWFNNILDVKRWCQGRTLIVDTYLHSAQILKQYECI